jgi:rSAM/selenodomain-associated transferase 1
MKKNTLVIFVREPRFGRVKTRLARDIGRFKAWMFYRRTVKALIRRVGHGNWQTIICVAPDENRGGFFDPRIKIIPQGGGDLGQRMQRVFDCVGSGPLVLIGGDIPGVRKNHIRRAFKALGNHDAVFGPASDGGYWLVGMRRRHARIAPFEGVRWSTEHALADTVANIKLSQHVDFTDMLSDVDRAADLAD